MLTPFLTAAICVAILLYAILDFGFEFFDIVPIILVAILGACLGLLIALLIGVLTPEDANIMDLSEAKEIVALKDNNAVGGQFFLGTGRIGSHPCYYYVSEDEHGLRMQHIDANNTYIIYSDENPRVERYESVGFNRRLLSWLAIPAYSYYVVYVPEGTITSEYTIDLE